MTLKVKEWKNDWAVALSAFGGDDMPIERDASGVPVAWRLFSYGPWRVNQNGDAYILLDITDAIMDSIIEYYKSMGNKVPIDSRHFLYKLAQKYEVEEIDIYRLLPHGQGTFGFGELEKRPDGLWIVNVEYVPLGRQIMAEGIMHYFSPVIRGLSNQRFRVTSVAMDNVPATEKAISFAASAEEAPTLDLPTLTAKLDAFAASAEHIKSTRNTNKKDAGMNKLMQAIAGLLGVDSIALGADNDADDGVITKINNLKTEVGELRTGKTEADAFGKTVRDSLGLSAETDASTVAGTLQALRTKSEGYDGLKATVDSLAASAESDKRLKLIDTGLAEGKLSKAMVDNWVNKAGQPVDSAALSAYLDGIAPGSVVPLQRIEKGDLPKDDSIALSAEDREVCRQTGVSEEDFLKAKKSQ